MVKKGFWTIISFALLIMLAFSLVQPATATPTAQESFPGADKVEPAVLNTISANGASDYVVEMAEKADLSAAYEIEDWTERGWFVYDTLKETAARTQQPVLDVLDASGVAYQSFFAGNEIAVTGGDINSLSAIAALPGVSHIRYPRTVSVEPFSLKTADVTVPTPDALDWGISDTGADDFWATFGIQGEGILVANIDTGVQWDHPALDQAFKCGTNPSDPDCWADPSNICGGSACDNNGHGSHTMGTMVGDDDPTLTYQVGMAPNAQWIACKGCETNSCSDTALNGCADWILAPGGDVANRPHIVNNSWGGGGGDNWYLVKVNAWRAAGIFPAFSAGNSGPTCGTIGSPGDYQESFATANHMSSRDIASSSSRGASTFGHDPYTKPNISAPGTSICSSVPTNSWNCGYSGTSMASPHSAGAVALLWSCNPSLIGDMTATFELLQDTADTPAAGNCGEPPDGEGNYTFGYGYLNVYAAGMVTCTGVETGTLEGYVYDTFGNPLQDATVSALSSTTTDATGYYTLELPEGVYSVTASKYGYATEQVDGVEILAGETTTQDFSLEFLGAWSDGPAACFDWTRYDAEFFPATGLIYALGGRSDASTLGSIYSYNPATGACADTGVDMPTPISNYTVNLVNDGAKDILCTFGGRDAAGATTLNVQCYDPLTNTAEVVTTLPAAYSGFTPGAQVVYNNKVYVFGGFRNTASPYELARTDRYDPVTNAFTQLGNLSLARSYLYAAEVDGKIFAFGGTVFDGTNLVAQTRAEVMADPEGTGTWSDAAVLDLPSAYDEGQAYGFDSDFNIELVAGKVVFAGGGQWPGESADVWTYDVATNTYDTSFPDLQYSRRNHGGVFVPLDSADPADGLPGLWVFGGRSGSDAPPYRGVEYFPLAYSQLLREVFLPAIMR